MREPDRQAGVTDSATKLQLILDTCRRLGVHTRPRRLGDLWIVPLLRRVVAAGVGSRPA